ncbi:hypothetical protein HK096_010838, partial [Nowakowskiella sp. JEL0078]
MSAKNTRAPTKISKSDISKPLSVTHVASFRKTLNDLSPTREIHANESLTTLVPEQITTSITPFGSGRFDTSASIAGSPLDPRMQNREPQKLTMQQFQNFIQAVGAFRRQLVAMGLAAEMFVRSLEEMSDFVPAADIKKPHIVGDLEFLIDSTHLIANSHQIWAETVEKEFEQPLNQQLKSIEDKAKSKQKENKEKISKSVELLQQEEDASYKMGKQRKRDFERLEKSLQI